jgi:formiminotetrahydrofolate cyclodeaminase
MTRSLTSYLDDLASAEPIPGGGSAAALAGAMAAALASMVARIASKKNPHERMRRLLTESECLRRQLQELAGRDSEAYKQVVEAMRLPRQTERQSRLRAQKLRAALASAGKVSREIAESSARVHTVACQLWTLVRGGLSADLAASLALAHAAAESSIAMAKTNAMYMALKPEPLKKLADWSASIMRTMAAERKALGAELKRAKPAEAPSRPVARKTAK